jgi:UDP-3-O-[3-hydroxymyristoyl] glucosamine N-acyltransferase
MTMTLAELAAHLSGTLIGDGALPITGAAGCDTVQAGEVTFVMDARRLAEAEASPAAAIIAPVEIGEAGKPLIQVADPRAAFAQALALFDWRRPVTPGIDPRACVAAGASVAPTAHVGAGAWVGEDAVIGDGAVIHPLAVIGYGVTIGASTVVHPHVTVYPHCTIGERCQIHAGTVIGADGHGYTPGPEGWGKVPHLGTVIIEDDVELGACVTVDRSVSGATVVGRGSKIDNLVMIAHNVQIGAHCMIVSQVGVAGSSVVEDWVVMAGQAGVADHRHIGKGAQLAVRAGVTRDVPAGAIVSGFPAQDHRDQLRSEAAVRKLPALLDRLKALEARVAELEGRDG